MTARERICKSNCGSRVGFSPEEGIKSLLLNNCADHLAVGGAADRGQHGEAAGVAVEAEGPVSTAAFGGKADIGRMLPKPADDPLGISLRSLGVTQVTVLNPLAVITLSAGSGLRGGHGVTRPPRR